MDLENIVLLLKICEDLNVWMRFDPHGLVLTRFFPDDMIFNRMYSIDFLMATNLSFQAIVEEFSHEADYKYDNNLIEV